MTRILRTLLAACVLFCAAQLFASPQDQYLQIYLLIQEAEKLEAAGQLAEAKNRYDVSLERLEKLQSEFSDWEPVIVRYRINFCKEKLDNLAEVASAPAEQPVNTTPTSPPPSQLAVETTPPSPPPPPVQEEQPSTVVEMPAIHTPAVPAPAPALTSSDTGQIQLLQTRIQELETELAQTHTELSTALSESSDLKSRQSILQAQIEALRQGINDAATQDNPQIAQLMDQNQRLSNELEQARAELLRAQSGASKASMDNLRSQLKTTQEKLDLTIRQRDNLKITNDRFQQELQKLQGQLASANEQAEKQNKTVLRENRILREIITRQIKQEERRRTAREMAMKELERLSIESATLKTQVDILSSPIVTLNNEEKEILQSLKASLNVAGGTTGGQISTTLTRANEPDYSNAPRVPREYRTTAEEAVQLFAERKFDEAAAKYQTILNAHPRSLYALSNLGVVRFQQQNYSEAEKVLKKAVELAPEDSFSHSILGIVLYQQGKYDEAVEILTRAVALDPNDPKTRNYLGISASQKGWQEAAEQECRTAIELDPNYGDAHFNLAVIYATQDPPSKELARKHYNRALQLGIPRDEQLEKLIN